MRNLLLKLVLLSVCLTFLLSSVQNVVAQDASPSATLTPTETPTETPTPTEEATQEDGEVLGGTTELGDTDSGRQMIKWAIAASIAVTVVLVGIRISKIRADE